MAKNSSAALKVKMMETPKDYVMVKSKLIETVTKMPTEILMAITKLTTTEKQKDSKTPTD